MTTRARNAELAADAREVDLTVGTKAAGAKAAWSLVRQATGGYGHKAKMGANRATAVFLDARLPHDGRFWASSHTPRGG